MHRFKSFVPMSKDVYVQMRNELSSLWRALREAPTESLAQAQEEIHRKLFKVNFLAVGIGGRVQRDAAQLKKDVDRFILGELNREQIDQMFIDALKLEQDTREL